MRESGSDVDNWTIGGVAAIAAAAIAAAVLFLQALVHRWETEELAKKTVTPQALRDHRSQEATKLSSYAWIDREKGVVRIPITRAMELVAARGLTGVSGPKADQVTPQAPSAPAAPAPAPAGDARPTRPDSATKRSAGANKANGS